MRSMGTAGTKALCGHARRGLEATPGRGGRPRGPLIVQTARIRRAQLCRGRSPASLVFPGELGGRGVRLGGALGAGATGAGGCAWQRWPAAGLLIVSPARLRRAQPRGGRSPASTGNPASNDCAQDTTSVARDGLRARSVRCFGVAGLRLAAGTSARLRTRHDVCRARLRGTRLGGALTCAEITPRDPDMSSTAYEYAPSASYNVGRRSASSQRAVRNGVASADVSRGGGRKLQGYTQPRMLCTL